MSIRTCAVALPLAVAPVASAGILAIDDFTAGAFSNELQMGVFIAQQDIPVLGGQRDYAVGAGANPFGSDLEVSVDPAVGLIFSAGPGVSGFTTFQYDGDAEAEDGELPLNPGDGLTIDASGFESIDLEFHFLDLSMGVEIELANVQDGAIVASSSLEQILDSIDEPTIVSFDLADFMGDVDLTDVNAITINFNTQINAPAARDFVLRDISLVPTPGAAALLGLAGIAAVRRRR